MQQDKPSYMKQLWQQPYNDDWSVSDLLISESSRNSERPALMTETGETITHGEIARMAGLIRFMLLENTTNDDSLTTLLTIGPLYFASIHAAFTCGLRYVTLDPESPEYRLRRIIRDTNTRVVVTDNKFIIQAEKLQSFNPSLIVLNLEESIDGSLNAAPAHAARAEDIAAFIPTSGSTGEPKIVIRSQRSYLHAVYGISSAAQVNLEDLHLALGSPGLGVTWPCRFTKHYNCSAHWRVLLFTHLY